MTSNEVTLTIAIPTHNRADLLKQALEVLMPQVSRFADVEVLVSDNCSSDHTQEVAYLYLTSGRLRYYRHAENIGSDRNFVFCYQQAATPYFWLCGDDDVILDGALDRIMPFLRSREYDLVYATSYGFRENFLREATRDPLDREYHSIEDTAEFVRVVNTMFTFISGIITYKERLLQLTHEEPESFFGTNLVQLSWSLPLLRSHRRSLVIWNRVVAARVGATNGYSYGQVFGGNFLSAVARLLRGSPELIKALVNVTIRKALPAQLFELRSLNSEGVAMEEAYVQLRRAYGRNPRFWVFLCPVLKLPLSLARVWLLLGAAINKLLYMLRTPLFWRKRRSG